MQIDPVDSKNAFEIIVSLQTRKFYKWCLFTYSFQNLFSQGSLNKLLCVDSYIDFKAIFGIYRVNLHNRILISTWFDDLHFSASSTVEAKTLRPSRLAVFGPRSLKFGMRPSICTPQLVLNLPADIQKLYYQKATLVLMGYWGLGSCGTVNHLLLC